MSIVKDLAVQTYCFRNFKNAEVAQMVRKCGLSKVELIDGGIHADFDKPEQFDEIISIYRNAGVSLCSFFGETLTDNAEQVRKNLAFGKAAGANVMTCDFDINTAPACFQKAGAIADEQGMRLAIHNHGGFHWLGNSQALEWVFNNSPETVGLCLDTADE